MKKLLIFTTVFNLFLLTSCSMKSHNKLGYLIDQEINSNDVQSFLNELGADYIISRYEGTTFEGTYNYIYRSKGVEIEFSKDDKLKGIFLYSESSSNSRQYQGELPYNLSFTDTREEIEQKIGLPDVSDGGGVINYYSIWNELGISITYKNKDINDMENKIHHISISKAKEK